MTLQTPEVDAFDDYAYEVTSLQQCSEREREEVTHYARVLCARGLSAEYIIEAVARYAKIRKEYSWWS